ncbi:ATP/GTP-binding protein [Streptomyces uncialis]|uniref:ATP/GTP-binding protein n=1 Tax=Streptomyces uncialis TaxID=1048205 RepID=UPI0037BB4FC2
MLLRFRVANHRSIRDEHVLSLIGTGFAEETARETPLTAGGSPIAVLPALGILGANASGKSNLLSALRFMRAAVRDSFADWAKAPDKVPREPFVLDPACGEETTLFEVGLLLGHDPVRYTYGFELSDHRVEAEWLHAYPHGKRKVWFDREAARGDGGDDEFVFQGTGFKGRRADLVALTRPNALFLSVGATFNDPQLAAVHRWFVDNLRLAAPGTGISARTDRTRRLLTEGNRPGYHQDRVERLLSVAELGVTGIDVGHEGGGLKLRHLAPDGGEVAMDFSEESAGTQAWFGLLGYLLTALDTGAVLLVDDLDSGLHPTLVAEVVRIFQDLDSNPRGAQLIFTTHDATLLGNAVLDRPLAPEQTWIATKCRSGETELYALTDAKPRQEENLEPGYLRGRYGGTPRIAAGQVAHELREPS